MPQARAHSPEPVSRSTGDGVDSVSPVDVPPLGGDLQADPSQPPRAETSSSAQAEEAAGFLVWDLVDEWGAQSFPASDPPANW